VFCADAINKFERLLLVTNVESASGFIKQKYRSFLCDRSSNHYSLPLTSRECA
jgi:hypothetical protein